MTGRDIIRKINFCKCKAHRPAAYMLALVLTVLTLVACSPKSGSGLLRFFFDGVPEKDTATVTMVNQSDSAKLNQNTQQLAAGPQFVMHKPYVEKACSKCHNSEAPSKTAYAQDQSCYSCHENYTKKYEVVHGPVAGGFCTSCHAPHYSENKKLLVRTGQALCLGCHEVEMVMKNETHAEIGNKSCMECHNAHGGNDRYLLN